MMNIKPKTKMKKILFIIYLLLTNLCIAQATEKNVKNAETSYTFDRVIELDSKLPKYGEITNITKFINTKNDEIFGIFYYGTFTIYDYQKGLKHKYKARKKRDEYKFSYTGTELLQSKTNINSSIKINKIAPEKYEITRFENNIPQEKLIAELQKSDEDLANSFLVDTEMLNTKNWLNELRKSENNQPFSFSNYQVLVGNELFITYKVNKIQKYATTITVPKK